ncbi:MAG: hypothetical protein O2780_11290 [Proteobacteria bacterium]|jgi:hypothetical protein|nr:hypothetical protein [Pseudomonadota bacterium]MDA1301598.1 hypothetical protein [Pseudomonadota bacterium]
MLLFVTGAAGSGKTTMVPGLRKKFPEYDVHDFDERALRSGRADTRRRQEQTEFWINRAIENQHQGKDTIICGGAVFGEILACPSVHQIEGLAACLLDCGDVERVQRIRSAGGEATMETLAWSAWLRMHCVDPTWYPQVIREQGFDLMNWANWEGWEPDDTRWKVQVIDTSGKRTDQILGLVAKWVVAQMSANQPLSIEPTNEDEMQPADRR